ncbi:MAG TPA: 3-dehydroquinate synthase [Planctomycetota bacterium]|nr:3-dehydroquinate synthase [Planctomycetota bacterium]
MKTVHVELGERSYEIRIAGGLVARVGEVLATLAKGGRVAVVTDANVGPRYADAVVRSLESSGFTTCVVTVPAGESSKSVAELAKLWDAFVAFEMDRGSTVAALGGGVVGDLAGFAAATFMRGVRCVQIPTTMLAAVDSSVGGKTAIDLASGKNLVGAFHQPAAVLIDPELLRTLPGRELAAGLAEVIKHGVIRDADFFARLERDIAKLLELDASVTADVIGRNCEIKAEVVSADERESGPRAILNYGHTVGHALETTSGERLVHGEAVAIGMAVESVVAEKLGRIGTDVTARQNALLSRAGLPTSTGAVDLDAVMTTMRRDKKARSGRLNVVLPTRIGRVELVKDVSPLVVREALEACRGG